MLIIFPLESAVITSTDPCLNNQCLNGATCEIDSTGSAYTCNCLTGFTGFFCEQCKIFKYK